MKVLLLMRHAKSSWGDATLADHDRPLNRRGRSDAPRMGRLLRREGLQPDVILSSSAKRALSTAEEVANSSGFEGEIRVTHALYGADGEDFIAALRELPAEIRTALVVSHNPGTEAFVEELSGTYERMPTAAIACLELALAQWAHLSAETPARLVDVWRPREMS